MVDFLEGDQRCGSILVEVRSCWMRDYSSSDMSARLSTLRVVIKYVINLILGAICGFCGGESSLFIIIIIII